MAKIGTAHIEIKPVIDEAALDIIVERVAAAVAEGIARGLQRQVGDIVARRQQFTTRSI